MIPRTPLVLIAGEWRILRVIQGGAPKKPQRFPVPPTPEDIARTKAKYVVLPVDVLDALADLLADALVESYRADKRKEKTP
jgi:hypothetical protein